MKRQITIYESAKNGKITVFDDVEVSTLGELKSLLREKGIDYNNKEFVEGVTNTKLLSDDSQIPTNIPFKGQTINDVFINILNKDTKIRSGIIYSELSRGDLLRAAKPYATEIEATLGVNYTRAKSADIAKFLTEKDNKNKPATVKQAEPKKEEPVKETKKEAPVSAPTDSSEIIRKLNLLKAAIEGLADAVDEVDTVEDVLMDWDTTENEANEQAPENKPQAPKSNFSDADIQNFIRRR